MQMLKRCVKHGSQNIIQEGHEMPFVFTITVSGGGGDDVKKANLTGQIDGSNQVFTVPETYVSNSLRVYYNGIRQVKDVSYTETNTTTFTVSFTPVSGEYITIDYVASS